MGVRRACPALIRFGLLMRQQDALVGKEPTTQPSFQSSGLLLLQCVEKDLPRYYSEVHVFFLLRLSRVF
jgi:hypothetical protein